MKRLFRFPFKILNKNFPKLILSFGVGYYLIQNNFNKIYLLDNNKANKNEKSEDYLKSYETISITEFEENIPKEIIIRHNNNDLNIIIIKKNNNYLALGGVDSSDYESLLKDGVVFGNKITSPSGSTYNIESGEAETPPSFLNLPIFSTFVNKKNNKLYVRIPEKVPKYLYPFSHKKEVYDYRKVVILGLSAAGIGCAETLRQMGYEGEITIITKEVNNATNKDLLTKYFNDKENNDFYYRKGNIEKDLDLNIYYGSSVNTFYTKESNYYIKINGDRKIEFDALLISTGSISNINKKYNINKSNQNYFMLKDHFSHKLFLKNIKKFEYPKIVLIGYNFKSIETAANLKREFPKSEITILEENKKNNLKINYGNELDYVLKNYLTKLGINIEIQKKLIRIIKNDDNEVKEFILKNGKSIESDFVLSFPNYFEGNIKFIKETKFSDDLEIDKNLRIIVNENLNTHRRRIFSAGSCSMMPYNYKSNNNYFFPESFNDGFLQGIISAYNILALNIPFHYIPSQLLKIYTLNLFKIGFHSNFNNKKVFGDINSNEFMIIYGIDNQVTSAIGTLFYKKKLDILQESLKIGFEFEFSQLSEEYIDLIYEKIKSKNKSGCYKNEIYKIKENFIPEKSIWKDRSLIDEELQEKIIDKEEIKQNVLKDESIINN